jgi:hypothetical protein
MTKMRHFILAASCLSLFASGCAVPYLASVRGPIRKVRVLDAGTGVDVPEATVSLTAQTSARFLGPPPCVLMCPDLCEVQAGKSRGVLLRNADLSFHMSSGFAPGSWGFFTGRPEDPNEYPRGVVIVNAPRYRPAMLRYTAGQILPGWSCVETLDPADPAAPPEGAQAADADRPFQGGRCELGDDGVLRFYLRPLKGEADVASTPGPAHTMSSLPHKTAR